MGWSEQSSGRRGLLLVRSPTDFVREDLRREPRGDHSDIHWKASERAAMANESAWSEELDETVGIFAADAASIVCALLYVARSARVDVLFAVCRMTRYLTKWMRRQDLWLV